MFIEDGWGQNARTATIYETGNSGISIMIHGPASRLMEDTKGSIVMPAMLSAWTKRSQHRLPASDVTRKMISTKEVSAHNVTDVMKPHSGRRLSQAPESFAVDSLKPAA